MGDSKVKRSLECSRLRKMVTKRMGSRFGFVLRARYKRLLQRIISALFELLILFITLNNLCSKDGE